MVNPGFTTFWVLLRENLVFMKNLVFDVVLSIPAAIQTIDHVIESTTIHSVMDQLSAVDPSMAYEPGGLGPRLLKELKQVVVSPRHRLFQSGLVVNGMCQARGHSLMSFRYTTRGLPA